MSVCRDRQAKKKSKNQSISLMGKVVKKNRLETNADKCNQKKDLSYQMASQ